MGVVDGQWLAKLWWGSKAEAVHIVGAKGLRMGITLSSQGGALEKAALLIDACRVLTGLTKTVVGPPPIMDLASVRSGFMAGFGGSSLLPRNASDGDD